MQVDIGTYYVYNLLLLSFLRAPFRDRKAIRRSLKIILKNMERLVWFSSEPSFAKFILYFLSHRYTLKLLAETCATANETSFTKWCYTVKLLVFFFFFFFWGGGGGFTTATVASRCRSRKRFYFSWNLSRNGSPKTFRETDHVTRCNACWNLFRSAVAHKFQLKFQRVTTALGPQSLLGYFLNLFCAACKCNMKQLRKSPCLYYSTVNTLLGILRTGFAWKIFPQSQLSGPEYARITKPRATRAASHPLLYHVTSKTWWERVNDLYCVLMNE